MRERPILMSGTLVVATLAGRKKVTRRLNGLHGVNEAPDEWTLRGIVDYPDGSVRAVFDHASGEPVGVRAPWLPGDTIWVRETFAIESNFNLDDEKAYPPPFKDGRPVRWVDDPDFGRYWQQAHYRATEPTHDLVTDGDDGEGGKWRPSIFMPRWASRLLLDVVSVRVERLHDITEEDARAEGVDPTAPLYGDSGGYPHEGHRDAFVRLWDAINGERAPWASNPWCWRIGFSRVQP